MSRQNKVNPSQYHVAGRLTPDDLARERVKQRNVTPAADATPQGQTAHPIRAEGSREKGAAGVAALMPDKPAKPRPRTRAAGRSRR
jgi:hypothetical protein